MADDPPRRNKVGRPPLVEGDPSVTVSVKLPGTMYDRVYLLAKEARCTVPEVIRRQLRRRSGSTSPDDPTR